VILSGYGNVTTAWDLNGFNQSIGTLIMSGVPPHQQRRRAHRDQPQRRRAQHPDSHRRIGGLRLQLPNSTYKPTDATISVNYLDLNGAAQTFNSSGNNTVINSVVQNGSLTKIYGGTLYLRAPTPTAAPPPSTAARCRSTPTWARSTSPAASSSAAAGRSTWLTACSRTASTASRTPPPSPPTAAASSGPTRPAPAWSTPRRSAR